MAGKPVTVPRDFGIGTLSRRTGVSVATLRFWEERGLLPLAGRSGSGQRRYDEADVGRVAQAEMLRRFGFSLAETARLLSLSGAVPAACPDLRSGAAALRDRVRDQLTALTMIERELSARIEGCGPACATLSGCPVLHGDMAP
jgi:DNA-binding transcriptional MerR regulator